jgi:hypothetical protein
MDLLMKNRMFAAMLVATMVGSPIAYAAPSQEPTGTVKLAISETTSMTELKDLLQKRGYTNIDLSPTRPNEENPRPDIQGTGGPASSKPNPDTTAVHYGWNGTAVRGGKRVNIVIDKNGTMTEK